MLYLYCKNVAFFLNAWIETINHLFISYLQNKRGRGNSLLFLFFE